MEGASLAPAAYGGWLTDGGTVMSELVVLQAGEAREVFALGPHAGRIVCAAEDSAGAYHVAEWTMSADAPPPHRHKTITETMIVLAGELELTDGQRTFPGRPGTAVTIPPGVVHGFKVVEGPSRLVVISTPGDKTDELVRAMVEAFAVADDPARMAEILSRADIELVG
jgi:quercetin dioxygenase-like cupin family protein